MKVRDIKTTFSDVDQLKDYLLNNCNYGYYNQLQNTMSSKKESHNLYYNNCKFNQVKVLKCFIKLLNKYFENKVIFCLDYKKRYVIYNRDSNKKTLFFSDYCYISFVINDFYYYIQFDENPFFDRSYIDCNKIYYMKETLYKHYNNRFFLNPVYANNKVNINDFINNLYSNKCNSKAAAEKIFHYFIYNVYTKQNKYAYDGRNKHYTIKLFNNNNFEYTTIYR